ncbi:NAD-binding protein [Salmonella enterica]|uniref:NAD-binding protein n=1 Tax=Salmonella enterica TaxID=28901 RepID=UPI003D2F2CCD
MLREAGADDADMLVAVTSSDETNMVARRATRLLHPASVDAHYTPLSFCCNPFFI